MYGLMQNIERKEIGSLGSPGTFQAILTIAGPLGILDAASYLKLSPARNPGAPP